MANTGGEFIISLGSRDERDCGLRDGGISAHAAPEASLVAHAHVAGCRHHHLPDLSHATLPRSPLSVGRHRWRDRGAGVGEFLYGNARSVHPCRAAPRSSIGGRRETGTEGNPATCGLAGTVVAHASAITFHLGEGTMAAKKSSSRRKYGKSASKRVKSAMHRRKKGTLKSGSGRKVKSRK